MRRLLTVCLGFCFAVTAVFGWLRLHSSKAQSATAHTATGGAVASVDTLATQIGIDVLKGRGNAVDAAVATAAALGVTEPFSAGIGDWDSGQPRRSDYSRSRT